MARHCIGYGGVELIFPLLNCFKLYIFKFYLILSYIYKWILYKGKFVLENKVRVVAEGNTTFLYRLPWYSFSTYILDSEHRLLICVWRMIFLILVGIIEQMIIINYNDYIYRDSSRVFFLSWTSILFVTRVKPIISEVVLECN